MQGSLDGLLVDQTVEPVKEVSVARALRSFAQNQFAGRWRVNTPQGLNLTVRPVSYKLPKFPTG